MASGVCRNCWHAQAAHTPDCQIMIPIDNHGNYGKCGCSNFADSEDDLHQLLEEALNLISERYSQALQILANH